METNLKKKFKNKKIEKNWKKKNLNNKNVKKKNLGHKNSLNTQIMTFADIHTYIHTHSSYYI